MSAEHPCKLGPNNTPCGDAGKCRFCYLFAHDDQYRMAWGGKGKAVAPTADWEQTGLSPSQMAWNAAKSLTKHVLAGCPMATNEERQRRQVICDGCDQYDAKNRRCLKCGCWTAIKSAMELERCPLNKWETNRTQATQTSHGQQLQSGIKLPVDEPSINGPMKPSLGRQSCVQHCDGQTMPSSLFVDLFGTYGDHSLDGSYVLLFDGVNTWTGTFLISGKLRLMVEFQNVKSPEGSGQDYQLMIWLSDQTPPDIPVKPTLASCHNLEWYFEDVKLNKNNGDATLQVALRTKPK